MQYCSHWKDIRKDLKSGTFALIDLRSPKEFAQGHIPEAINLPLLDNDERHTVGKLYKEAGKYEAVTCGLAIFAAKAPTFLSQIESLTSAHDIAIYCWRGGMRSRLVGAWLSLARFKVRILKGGYKNFRRDVLESMQKFAEHPKIVLNGRTGSGKTLFLKDLQNRGYPAIDFEGIACHRGSAFGGLAQRESSPTQQNFENQLYDAYLEVETWPKILLEIENFIGPVRLPQKLRESLKTAPMVFLSRDFDDRVKLLTQIYCNDWNAKTEQEFVNNLPLLKKYLSGADQEQMIQAMRQRNFGELVSQLLRLRYDRVYDKSLTRHQSQAMAHFNLSQEEAAATEFLQNVLQEKIIS